VVTGAGATGATLAGHPDVNHISFTGSANVGALVQAAAAKHAVPVTLELGGRSPQLVFADADLERAARFCVNAGIQNAGQTCSASSRILIQREIFDAFVEKMAARYHALRVGPALADRDLGPLISAEQQAIVNRYAALARRDGTIVAEGTIETDAPKGGHYFAPILVGGLNANHAAAQEEIFGPLQIVLPFDTEEEATTLANGTPYGLVAGVWTADGARQMRLARDLRAGQVFINNYGAGGGVELPFGGTGRSGHGREKGFEALYGFTRLKTVAAWHGRE
jgi:aldehyde dehydrogenase (NAD+)